jgi:hypothetical protein
MVCACDVYSVDLLAVKTVDMPLEALFVITHIALDNQGKVCKADVVYNPEPNLPRLAAYDSNTTP